MHIHVPKPIHGWKQFFNEVFVIVVGIAIALSGEQLLERWNEHHQANRSFEAIKDEVATNVAHVKARLATADCIDRRLAEVADYIERGDETHRPSWVGRPQIWAMQTSAVDAARSYGSLTALPFEDQRKVSNYYGGLNQYETVEMDEQMAWAELRSITEDRDLSDSDKASLRQALQKARYDAWLLRVNSEQSVEQAREIGVSVQAERRGSQSVCVAMSTPFDEAVRLSGGNHGEPR